MKETIIQYKKPLIIVVLVAVVVLAYVYREKWLPTSLKDSFTPTNNSNSTSSNTETKNTSNSTSNTTATVTNDTILKKGTTGDKVKELQKMLNDHLSVNFAKYGGSTLQSLVLDGSFGAKTEERLFLFTGKKSISINDFKTNYYMKTTNSPTNSNANNSGWFDWFTNAGSAYVQK